MTTQVLLFRGINVGGKNKVAMTDLRECLEKLGCTDVVTYLASGNAIVDSPMPGAKLAAALERELPRRFHLDDELVKVLALSPAKLRAIISKRPKGFGDQPNMHHSDAIFLMDVGLAEAMKGFDPREGVDVVWPGDGVIYSQRLSAQRTKSRLGKAMSTPAYKSMTIRSWATTTKLVEMLDARKM
ncbi:MAG: DUF1697 domain-containing protein [Pseudolysinimonas sp.]